MNSEQAQYNQLVKPIEHQMIQAVWRIIRHPQDAEDALQEALMRLWKKWQQIKKHPNPKALILTICIHAAYDVLRQRGRKPVHENLDDYDFTLPDDAALPSEKVERSELHAALLNEISKLPQNQRIAVHMRYVEGFSDYEIAAALGCAEVTVRKHVSRACEKLRRQLPQVKAELLN